MAGARLAIVNGIGYDDMGLAAARGEPAERARGAERWRPARAARRRQPPPLVLPVQRAARKRASSPTTTASTRPAPPTSPRQRRVFETRGLRALPPNCVARSAPATPGCRWATARASSRPLGEALGLRLLTPYSFAKAIAEGTEVTAQDKQTVDSQAKRTQDQGVGIQQPERHPGRTARQRTRARRAHPDHDVTETLSPASDTFEQWQVAELEGLARALHAGDGEVTRLPHRGGAPATRRGSPGRRTVWSGVDLASAEGEFVAVLGPNGAGKSTLLRVLLGLLPLDHGAARVLGGPARRRNERIGYLPQRRVSTPPRGSAGSTWCASASTGAAGECRCRWAAEHARGRASASRRRSSGSAPARTRPARSGECSGGEQQRLLIAQALVQRPAPADPRRAPRQPRPAQPGRGRRVGPAASAAPRG